MTCGFRNILKTIRLPIKNVHTVEPSKPNGVFVFKVSDTRGLHKTLCTLNVFFNHNANYPIRIFTDHSLEEEDANIFNFTGNADTKVISIDRWKQLPPSLTAQQRKDVIEKCQDFDDPEKARCTKLKVSMGYVFNTYWSYMEMADEPDLQGFDYFVLFDADAFLTKPMQDPFEIMRDNNLVGLYNLESHEGGLTSGVQEAAEASFTLEERKHAYLNSPEFPMFDELGTWGGPQRLKPGVWMCMFGGRLDFLRSKRFKEFAVQLPYHTYMERTSRQAVIPIGWSVLAGGDKVWYLPKRGIEMGIYHHGWVDDHEVIRQVDGKGFATNTLLHWNNFTESKIGKLMKWKEYMEVTEPDSLGWQKCIAAKGSSYGA